MKSELNGFMTAHDSAALEYWFFKVNCGPFALLVDWIERRNTGQHLLRVSINSPFKREVLFEEQEGIMTGGNTLGPFHTEGHLAGVSWNLDFDPGRDWIKPDIFPAGLLRMTDLRLVSAPLALFNGWIRHDGQEVDLHGAKGMVSHYWGRKLAQEWWWLSCNQFDQPDVAVECAWLRTGLWGSSFGIPIAYLYLNRQGRKEFIMAPFGMASVTGSDDHFELIIRRIGADPVIITGTGRDYCDLGDGIVNTLVGDLEIRSGSKLIARASGTAGLEHRSPV